jgi:hypothetical protein
LDAERLGDVVVGAASSVATFSCSAARTESTMIGTLDHSRMRAITT